MALLVIVVLVLVLKVLTVAWVVPSVALPTLESGVLLFPRSSNVLSGSDRVSEEAEIIRHSSTYGGEEGVRNPSIQVTSSHALKFLSASSHLPLSSPWPRRREEKRGRTATLRRRKELPHTTHPCPQMAQCCFGDGLKR